MDTLEWTLWPARWAILLTGLLAQVAALAWTLRRGRGPDSAGDAPRDGTPRARHHTAAPADGGDAAQPRTSGPAPFAPAASDGIAPGTAPAAPGPRIPRIPPIVMLTGGGLVALFALLERDMLLLSGQVLALPLLWPRQR